MKQYLTVLPATISGRIFYWSRQASALNIPKLAEKQDGAMFS
jgi:hypothetical protein